MRSKLLWLLPLTLAACTPATSKPSGEGEELGEGGGGDEGGTRPDGDSGGADGGETGGDTAVDPGPIDADGDGWLEEEDCDDADPGAYPGAEELEGDGRDNDCDGWIDELRVCEGVGPEIQAAVDAAPEGGAVIICPGTWYVNLDLSDRDVALIGEEGSAATILAAENFDAPVVEFAGGAQVTLQGLTITGGTAAEGAGLRCLSSDLSADDLVITGNAATGNGGGLYARACDLELSALRLEGNSSGGYGGGAYLARSGGTLAGSAFIDNTALEGGGAFVEAGDLEILNNLFQSNDATGASETVFAPGGGGGGLWVSASPRIEGNEFTENTSNYNGGGVLLYGLTTTFADNTVQGNTAGGDGGGVYGNSIGGSVEGNSFSGNAAADDGGGLRLYVGTADVVGNYFSANSAADDGGGCKMSHSTHEFLDNVLEDNSAGDAGGGLELDNDSSHVEGAEFRRNSAWRGAGLHSWRTERRFTIEGSVFEENIAGDCGGGLSFDNNPYQVRLRQLELRGNQASDGGGICVDLIYRDPEDVGGLENYYEESQLNAANLLFVGNSASSEGGVLYAKAGTVSVHNISADSNSGAGAIASKGAHVELVNAIIAEHEGAALYAADVSADYPELSTSLTVSYSNLHAASEVAEGLPDPTGEDGNISEDPRWDGDYGLRSSSPCIDAGDPDIEDADGSRSDMGLTGGPEGE